MPSGCALASAVTSAKVSHGNVGSEADLPPGTGLTGLRPNAAESSVPDINRVTAATGTTHPAMHTVAVQLVA
ncbi:hypothetical protein MTER_29360 [Mycolicibacter terrae]|uniref:Uncharacterized protein n=1 Tax=Mycolicibacter terrae TaxID=1788 RepID=A0AAD1I095_9MYCO|nr:hypothetical protein MTER_29360 [Mycolicibacter terrae]